MTNKELSYELPGGKRYQKDGERLEKAFFKNLPWSIKNKINVNVKPSDKFGNIYIEFDMIYYSEITKRIISFEIKGVNKNTINNVERQKKLIRQGFRQKNYLVEKYNEYIIDIIYCFIIGNQENKYNDCEWKIVSSDKKNSLNTSFIKRLKKNGFRVAIGETPQQCVIKALTLLNL